MSGPPAHVRDTKTIVKATGMAGLLGMTGPEAPSVALPVRGRV